MANPNSSSRTEAATRPEPREPRVEPRTPAPRSDKALEPRPIEVRAPEIKVPDATPRVSMLGPTLRFRGELSAQEDLVVQGSVEGSITHTQCLAIGTDGSMKGDIRARVIVIDGRVEGNLYATEFINVRATAKVKGNVFAPRVAIQDGAFFQGQVEMQPSGAAVQEHSARQRQAAATAAPGLDAPAIDKVLSGGGAGG